MNVKNTNQGEIEKKSILLLERGKMNNLMALKLVCIIGGMISFVYQ